MSHQKKNIYHVISIVFLECYQRLRQDLKYYIVLQLVNVVVIPTDHASSSIYLSGQAWAREESHIPKLERLQSFFSSL